MSGVRPQGMSSEEEKQRLIDGAQRPTYGSNPSIAPARQLQLDSARQAGIQNRIRAKRALIGAVIFCFIFMIIEAVGGFLSHSLAVLTDAAHLLTDVGALSLSLFAIHVSSHSATSNLSFGWHRAEVVGALASVFTIWALVGAILYEAVQRTATMWHCAHSRHVLGCEAVNAPVMVVIGVCGMIVNLACAWILSAGGHGHSHGGLPSSGHGHSHGGTDGGHGAGKACEEGTAHGHNHGGAKEDDHGHSHGATEADHGHSHGGAKEADHGHSHGGKSSGGSGSLNIDSAFLHALGDCIQSAGVIFSALFIWYFNRRDFGKPMDAHSIYNLADPACSMLFGVITLFTTKSLFKQLISILMESTPDGISYDVILAELSAVPHVMGVHDLHIWCITPGMPSLSVHLVSDSHQAVLQAAQDICEAHGITHTTIQVDTVEVDVARCASSIQCAN